MCVCLKGDKDNEEPKNMRPNMRYGLGRLAKGSFQTYSIWEAGEVVYYLQEHPFKLIK